MDLVQKKIKIYQSLSCPFCQKVKLAMELLSVPYFQYEIDIANFEHEQEWFKHINPEQTVPALILTDNTPAFESFPFIKKLDSENGNVFSKQNGENYETALKIVSTQLGKAFWTYLNAWGKAENKNDASLDELYKNLHDVLVSLAKEYKFENSFFFGSKEHPSLFDVGFFSNIYQIYLLSKLILKKDIFSSTIAEEDAALKKFLTYINFTSKLEEFQRVTYKPAHLPEEGTNFYLKENEITIPDQFNYEDYLVATVCKKYNLKI
ncbi:hypothetical protein ABPG74_006065 [Tetrahymena malaccensis]